MSTLDKARPLKHSGLTYHSCQEDINEVKRCCTDYPSFASGELENICLRQSIHSGNVRSDPNLRTLDQLKASGLTYRGWKEDFEKAERYCIDCPSLALDEIRRIRERQSAHIDRSDSNLRALDQLKASGLTYDGWQKDFEKAERHCIDSPNFALSWNLAPDAIERIKRKQSAHTDRSDPNLHALDQLKASGLTYDGWQEDFEKAEEYYVDYPSFVSDAIKRIRRRQSAHTDRSDLKLRTLDQLKASGLTYDGWEDDFEKAERYCIDYPNLALDEIRKISSKQLVHTERSDPNLRALGQLKASGLSYNGWQTDFERAERYCIGYPNLASDEIERIKRKWSAHSDRSDPNLRALDQLKASGLTYDGWQNDFKGAEDYCIDYPNLAPDEIKRIRRKQLVRTDRSDPNLRALDQLKASGLTYTGWQEDFEKAEEYCIDYPSFVSDAIQKIRRKHAAHTARSDPNLPALTNDGWQEDSEKAEHHCTDDPNLASSGIISVKREQSVRTDRSDPNIYALGQLKASGLTYDGWQKDFERAERYCVNEPNRASGRIKKIRRRQEAYDSRVMKGKVVGNQRTKRKRRRGTNRGPIIAIDLTSDDDFPVIGGPELRLIKQRKAAADISRNHEISECVSCLASMKTHVFVPCGHQCVCASCAHRIMSTSSMKCCPLCRGKVTACIKVFN